MERVIDKMVERMWTAYQLRLRELEKERRPDMKKRRKEAYLQMMAQTSPETFDQDAMLFEEMFGPGALEEESHAAVSATMRKIRGQ